MAELEYKTVAMPQLVRGRRKRRQTRAEMVAELVSTVINKQAAQGWRYAGTDTFTCFERPRLFARRVETVYTVLIFDRPVDPSTRASGTRDAVTAEGEAKVMPKAPGGGAGGGGDLKPAPVATQAEPGGPVKRTQPLFRGDKDSAASRPAPNLTGKS
ncbi:MAG: hypothetical protein AAFV62_09710 [Pseudomonadota bacterium]